MIPSKTFLKINGGKSRKDKKRNDFLHHFQLRDGKVRRPQTISRYLKTVFNKSNGPTCYNDQP